MWHCPHCGAPQAETARCWVCRRSSTTCSTCSHFRTSLAADLGYCALDRQRRPLTGRELRGCWTEGPPTGQAAGRPRTPESATAVAYREGVPTRGFVPLDEVAPAGPPPAAALDALGDAGAPDASLLAGDAAESWGARTSLFGEAER